MMNNRAGYCTIPANLNRYECSRILEMQESTDKYSDCIRQICDAALNSTAVHHPYLDALQAGTLPDMRFALQELAFQYGFYSADFIKYVSAVIKNLRSEKHKHILRENLAEENGDTHGLELPEVLLACVEGVSHSELYTRFQESLGIDHGYRQSAAATETVLQWRDDFLQLCQMNECAGVGAIGIGTELLVSQIYSKILQAIRLHTDLSTEQYVFFELHSVCDDEHAGQVIRVCQDLAKNEHACEQIESGARLAIEMRTAFWDEMYERALGCKKMKVKSHKGVSCGYQSSL